jgi:hypothetical protein
VTGRQREAFSWRFVTPTVRELDAEPDQQLTDRDRCGAHRARTGGVVGRTANLVSPLYLLINIPITVIALVTTVWIPKDDPLQRRPLSEIATRNDVSGIVLSGGMMSALPVFLLSLPSPDWIPLGVTIARWVLCSCCGSCGRPRRSSTCGCSMTGGDRNRAQARTWTQPPCTADSTSSRTPSESFVCQADRGNTARFNATATPRAG